MKKIAMILNGVVKNIAVWDGETEWSPEGFTLVDVTDTFCGPGFTYQDGVFTPPVDPE